MPKLGDLAREVDGELVGNAGVQIRGIAALEDAGPEDISFAANMQAMAKARTSRAGALLVPRQVEDLDKPFIRVADPRLGFARLLALFAPDPPTGEGVHPSAVIGEGVKLGRKVWIQAGVTVGDGARMGRGVVVHPGAYIGPDVEIGDHTVIHANVVIREGVVIGKHCVIHAGAVIGADGFGYVWDESRHHKIPQIGTVMIGDDVEIGANATVDRATCGVTRIGRGSKIDSLVQVGHNVVLGEDVLVVALVGIAGSARIGDRVTLAGQSGVTDHLTIGADSVVASRGLVAGDLPPKSFVSGFPARPHAENMRVIAATRRLPELLKTMADLQRRVAFLEGQLAQAGNSQSPAGLRDGEAGMEKEA